MCAASSARLRGVTARMSFRTRMHTAWVSVRSIFTRCASRRRNSGANPTTAPSTSIYGRVILSTVEDGALQSFESLLRDEGNEATFAEPWQAQAFALVVHLHSKGASTWEDWADALAEEIKRAAARGEPDEGTHYYDHWLAALERLVRERGLA